MINNIKNGAYLIRGEFFSIGGVREALLR